MDEELQAHVDADQQDCAACGAAPGEPCDPLAAACPPAAGVQWPPIFYADWPERQVSDV